MTQEELQKILNKHKLWLDSKNGGKRANLSGADLSGADLRSVKGLLSADDNEMWG